MKATPFILILLIISAIVACSKDKNPEEPAAIPFAKYKTDNKWYINPVVLYTTGGKITDSAQVQAFLRYNKVPMREGATEPLNGTSTIFSFFENNQVSANINDKEFPYEFVFKNDSVWLLASVDSADRVYYPDNSCYNFYGINPEKYRLPSICKPLPSEPANTICRYRAVVPFNLKNNEFFIPVLTAVLKKKGIDCSADVSDMNNNLNGEIITNLKQGDTLIVQMLEWRLIKIL